MKMLLIIILNYDVVIFNYAVKSIINHVVVIIHNYLRQL